MRPACCATASVPALLRHHLRAPAPLGPSWTSRPGGRRATVSPSTAGRGGDTATTVTTTVFQFSNFPIVKIMSNCPIFQVVLCQLQQRLFRRGVVSATGWPQRPVLLPCLREEIPDLNPPGHFREPPEARLAHPRSCGLCAYTCVGTGICTCTCTCTCT